MPKLTGGRPAFRKWVDGHAAPKWGLMPLTHVTKGIVAEDIIESGTVAASDCDVFKEPLAYLFYGRPAYRVAGDGVIKVEAACPFCFVFDAALISKAKAIFPFDTGAFSKRLYSRILIEEMAIEDFSLETDTSRPDRIIAAVFESRRGYFEGDTSKINASKAAEPWDFHARAYLDLLASPGRNEPDDRVCSIEVIFGESIPLRGNLLAAVVPHTLWNDDKRAPWLEKLVQSGVGISPYIFVPGRHPDYYQAQLEVAVRELYVSWGAL
ncbi:hypothetical protein MesoLj113c_09090 [Mesorhizobium sp. 113-3-9]|uniref:hypothetical protein n=1 Tax=Mesorhizobium sp. 113-3-9 TaxID=2744517 RepID=UPI0019270DCD|nr:hypothetical protein [Mesorhizobium sp. 113-3-9]BCG84799.1 hypothetical protein MesoLj113c_09090 [Mesorhizobium sp. 113-3-9]